MAELLADHTTLRVGGPARRFVRATTEAELIEVVRATDAAGEPLLVLGGGSNLLVGDAGFDGTVVQVATRGISTDPSACGWTGVEVAVAAGERWDTLIDTALERSWSGLEPLAGIPGLVGASPIQNVGAYGADVSQLISRVRTWDRQVGAIRSYAAADCGFAYRDSRFKQEPGRWVVLEVVFDLRVSATSAPIRYAELARSLGVEIGERAPARAVAEAVLALRRGKGMVLEGDDHDTWSAGSFFTNPVLDAVAAERLPAPAPRWPVDGGSVKTSAAWLIQHAGFDKGYGHGAATLSTKHALALTNRGGASAAELCALAREIRDGVRARTGVTLVNEPVMINCSLDQPDQPDQPDPPDPLDLPDLPDLPDQSDQSSTPVPSPARRPT